MTTSWSGDWLPIEPLRQWLEELIARHESLAAVSELTGIPARRLYQYRRVNSYVPLDLVDEARINAGGTGWRDLYSNDDIIDRTEVHRGRAA